LKVKRQYFELYNKINNLNLFITIFIAIFRSFIQDDNQLLKKTFCQKYLITYCLIRYFSNP
jgi:hypothetical protein